MMRFSSFFAKLIVMKPASRQSIIDWVASTWSKIKQHPDMVAKSFLVTRIASDLDRSEDDIIMNAEVQEEISAKWENPQNVDSDLSSSDLSTDEEASNDEANYND